EGAGGAAPEAEWAECIDELVQIGGPHGLADDPRNPPPAEPTASQRFRRHGVHRVVVAESGRSGDRAPELTEAAQPSVGALHELHRRHAHRVALAGDGPREGLEEPYGHPRGPSVR